MKNNGDYTAIYKQKYSKLRKSITRYNPQANWAFLRHAYDFAREAHHEQIRQSGDPYFEHCHQVSLILSELKMDTTAIASGLLHDVVEDVGVTLQELKEEFNSEVALIVDGVTKIGGLKFASFEEKQAENFRKMLLSMTKDIRVILIKFADRLHNMRTLGHLLQKKRERIALETRDVYAPLAYRFGLYNLKMELDDLAFKYIEENVYEQLRKQFAEDSEWRAKYIKNLAPTILKKLKQMNIKGTVRGRPKNLYSIHLKMKNTHKPFDSIYDLLGIRIIVPQKEDCYITLGIIHSLYTPIQDRLKDYIANPKINGYQSIHTTVIGPKGLMVEVQIRTEEMHSTAEEGIAAHWLYKEGKTRANELDKHLSWIRQVLEQPAGDDPDEFMKSLKINLYQDEVFVFTPDGEVISLPKGSTPIDFAFAIHTDIGLHCIAAKSNGNIIPLSSHLESGSTVEIITSDNQTPSQDWLNYTRTSKARSRINRWLKESQFDQSVKLGEDLLTKHLKKLRMKISKDTLADTAQALNFEDLPHLYAAIGRGDMSLKVVTDKLLPSDKQIDKEKESILVRFLRRSRNSADVTVQGVDNLMMAFGKCCNPVPGDKIVGFITQGKGITVHRLNCTNVDSTVVQAERIIEAEWDVEPGNHFLAHIRLFATDRKSLLSDIAQVIASEDVNITDVHITVDTGISNHSFILQVKNLRQLNNTIRKIRKVKDVIEVQRIGDIREADLN